MLDIRAYWAAVVGRHGGRVGFVVMVVVAVVVVVVVVVRRRDGVLGHRMADSGALSSACGGVSVGCGMDGWREGRRLRGSYWVWYRNREGEVWRFEMRTGWGCLRGGSRIGGDLM